MSKYDFINEVDRNDVSSVKVNSSYVNKMFRLSYNKDTISMWVSEMDYLVAPEIEEALVERVRKGILGYTTTNELYYQSIMDWAKKRYNVEIEKKWIIYSHGTVPAIRNAIRVFTNEGDKVIIQTPVYGQFASTIKETNRIVLENQLIESENGCLFDFESFEELAKEAKMFIICNPHNPSGEVWSKADLEKITEIAKRNDLLIFSDEVHSDILRSETVFTSMLNIDYDKLIVVNSLSKTFNLTGLHVSHVFIKNQVIRRKYNKYTGWASISPIAFEATIAAYTKAEKWLNEANVQIEDNFIYAKQFIDEKIPNLKFMIPKGTYLGWIDFRNYEMNPGDILKYLSDEASLVFGPGKGYGSQGEGFARIVLATPRSVLKELLTRLEKALNSLKIKDN